MPVGQVAHDPAFMSRAAIGGSDHQNVAMSGRRDLNGSDVLGEEQVGDIGKHQPEHLR